MRPKDAFGHYGCVPREMHPAWHQRVGAVARTIGRDLISMVDDFGSMSIDVDGDWRESLCKKMSVDGGPDRRVYKAALTQLEKAGLLVASSARVTMILRPECSLDAHSTLTACPLRASRKSQLGEIVQKLDRQQASEASERARAPAPARAIADRPDVIGFTFVASLLGRDVMGIAPLNSYPTDYHWIGTRPALERSAVFSAVNADAWCIANKGHVDAPHLVKQWQKYLAGRPKSVAKVEAPTPRYRDLSKLNYAEGE